MSSAAIALIVTMLVFMLLGAPIYLAILIASVASAFVKGVDPSIVIQRMYAANDSFSLLAVPFFYMAGDLMVQGGIAKRLVNLARSLLGRLRGALTIIDFVACAFFGAISGSSYATTASIGKLMYPEMLHDGYEKGFAAVLQAVGGTLGVLIPPSILCVLYGVATGASVGDMLLYIAPVGILTTLVYMLTAQIMISDKKWGFYDTSKEKKAEISGRAIWESLKDAFWAILSPIIILGGIYSGVCTPTECAAIACVYALIVGLFVYKELNLKVIFRSIMSSVLGTACVTLIFDSATAFSYMMTVNRIAASVANWVNSTMSSAVVFLLLVNLVYAVAGMFVEGSVTITVITPLLFPIAKSFGIDPIHFGVVTILNCIIGTLTPPFGGALFIASSVTEVPVTTLVKRVWPFVLAGFALCLAITYVPFAWLY